MKNKIYFLSIKYVLITLLFLIHFSKNTQLSFTFPTATTLNNGNILIIHKTGITICDSNLSTKIRDEEIFSEDKQITSQNLAKVSLAKFTDGCIVSVIIDRIIVFNKEGYRKGTKTLPNMQPNYYTVAAHKYDIDYYYFLVGYFYNNFLYLNYYKSSFSDTKIYEGSKLTNYIATIGSKTYSTPNRGISCQFLKFSDTVDYILCLYHAFLNNVNYIFYNTFSFDKQSGTFMQSFYIESMPVDTSTECIKSSVNSNHSEGLFCYYSYDYSIHCEKISFLYDNETYSYDDIAKHGIQGFKVEYFQEKEQFLFTYLSIDGGIIIDNDFEDEVSEYYLFDKYTECNDIFSYSVLYLNAKEKYYLLTDSQCEAIEYNFDVLFDEESDDKLKESDKIEEEEKEEEEEDQEEEGQEEEEEEEEEEKEEEEEYEKIEEKEEEQEEESEKEEEKEEEEEEKKEEEEEEEGEEEEEFLYVLPIDRQTVQMKLT